MTQIAFRDSGSNRVPGGQSTGQVQVVIPAAVQAGDTLLLGYIADSSTSDTGGQGVISDPAGVTGWSELSPQQSLNAAIAKGWYKVAEAADAGATVTIDYTGDTMLQKAAGILGAWSGGDTANPLAVISPPSDSSTSSVSHVMPVIDTTGFEQCLIISLYLGREPTASASYTTSAGWTLRAADLGTAGSTGGQPEAAIIDSGTQVAAGAGQGGGTITGDQAANYNFAWTVALAPAIPVQTARPTVDVTTANWTPSTSLGAGVQESSLVADGSDSTYVTSIAAPSAQVWEAKLPTMSAAPDTVTNRVYFTGGAVSGTVVTDLVQGTTVIATRTDSYDSVTPPPTAPADLVLTLTGAEQAAITDLADLRIRCTVTAG